MRELPLTLQRRSSGHLLPVTKMSAREAVLFFGGLLSARTKALGRSSILLRYHTFLKWRYKVLEGAIRLRARDIIRQTCEELEAGVPTKTLGS